MEIKAIVYNFIGERWDGVELYPVRQDSDGSVQHCEPETAHFWSVYVRLESGPLHCIADCADRQNALIVYNWIKSLFIF